MKTEIIEEYFDFEMGLEDLIEKLKGIEKDPKFSNYRFENDTHHYSDRESYHLVADREETEEEIRTKAEQEKDRKARYRAQIEKQARELGII